MKVSKKVTIVEDSKVEKLEMKEKDLKGGRKKEKENQDPKLNVNSNEKIPDSKQKAKNEVKHQVESKLEKIVAPPAKAV